MRYNPLLHGAAKNWDEERKPHKGGGGGGSQTVQNYSPAEAKRRTELMDTAKGIYQNNAGQVANSPYPGPNVVGFSPDTVNAQDWLRNYAATTGIDLGNQTWQGITYGMNDAMDVENNPFLANALQGAIRPITQSYTDPGGVMAQIRSAGIDSGGYGDTRQAITEGVAAGRYANEIGDVASQMYSDAYNKGQDTFARTLALLPQSTEVMQQPGLITSGIGSQQENLQQLMEDREAAARDWELNKEWEAFYPYANIVMGMGSSQSTTKTQTPSPSPLGQMLGGASMGFGVANMLGMANPLWGAGIGALGGALGLF